MAIFSHNISYVSRRQGRSIAAASAYRSGERLLDDYTGKVHDYTHRQDVLYKEILLPPDAPREFAYRQVFVSAIDASEKRSNARTAREIKVALPNELYFVEQVSLIKDYVLENFVKHGMCADIAIHEGRLVEHMKPSSIEPVYGRQNNPHAHILLTTRMVDRNGFYKTKCREWDRRSNVVLWRRGWADAQNKEFARLDLDGVRVSHESLAAQGEQREPTKHLGPVVMALELRSDYTDRGDEYRETMTRNKERERERMRSRERVRERRREYERTR